MRLFHLELEREPALAIELHPRLTVVGADAATRARVVDAFDALLRGRASGLRGALITDDARSDFAVESTSGPVLPAVPTIVRAADIGAVADADVSATIGRAEARHADALAALNQAEEALVEQQQVIATLHARQPVPAGAPAAPPTFANGDAGGGEPEACRRLLREYVVELQDALQSPSLPDQRRVQLLERGTVLAADASRLGVCRPASVRALLDAVDAFNVTPSLAGGAPVTTLVREVVLDLDAANGLALYGTDEEVVDSAEVRAAEERLDVLERDAGAARSRALAVFAELESIRRATGTAEREPGGAFSSALRARLGRPMPTSWVGPTPIVVDDALVGCPPDDLNAARAALVDAAQRTQVVYVTDDTDALAWAQRLPPDQGALARPAPD
jgi:hypothetical protein